MKLEEKIAGINPHRAGTTPQKRRRRIGMKKRTAISIFVVLGIVLTMTAGAALVNYLSNTVTTTVTVSSPMEQWISKSPWSGYVQDDTVTFPDVLGGETVTFYVKTINNANVEITGEANNVVTNWAGVTCNDFAKVELRTTSDWGTTWDPASGYYDLIALGLCSQNGNYKVEFSYGPVPIVWAAGQVDITEVKVTFDAAAFGTYTITSQIVPHTP